MTSSAISWRRGPPRRAPGRRRVAQAGDRDGAHARVARQSRQVDGHGVAAGVGREESTSPAAIGWSSKSAAARPGSRSRVVLRGALTWSISPSTISAGPAPNRRPDRTALPRACGSDRSQTRGGRVRWRGRRRGPWRRRRVRGHSVVASRATRVSATVRYRRPADDVGSRQAAPGLPAVHQVPVSTGVAAWTQGRRPRPALMHPPSGPARRGLGPAVARPLARGAGPPSVQAAAEAATRDPGSFGHTSNDRDRACGAAAPTRPARQLRRQPHADDPRQRSPSRRRRSTSRANWAMSFTGRWALWSRSPRSSRPSNRLRHRLTGRLGPRAVVRPQGGAEPGIRSRTHRPRHPGDSRGRR